MDNRERSSIIVEFEGEGEYEFALDDNTIFQDSNTFEFLEYGSHKVYIRDKNGCLPLTEVEFVILDNPRFFTPDGDGNYDTWNINNINAISNNFNTISNITIFDRYGKIIADINPNGLGWDGNYLGNPVPSSDYWFSLNLTDFNGKTITKKGHFSLQ
jgi:gliding motility-associated-like protein